MNGEDRDPTPRVAIVDDHQLMSASVGAALRAEGFDVRVPNLADAGTVEAELREAPPTVALLDLDLGAFGRGEDLLPLLVELGARVLVVSGVTDEPVVGRCLQAGAWGWVPKSAAFDVLLDAVRAAARGVEVLDRADRERLLRAWRERRVELDQALAPFDRLSRRETEVLSMLQAGKSVDRIAAECFVSEATVRTQVRAILTKLGVNSQLEAVAMATRAGWSGPTGIQQN